jgi:hypothetical protein
MAKPQVKALQARPVGLAVAVVAMNSEPDNAPENDKNVNCPAVKHPPGVDCDSSRTR